MKIRITQYKIKINTKSQLTSAHNREKWGKTDADAGGDDGCADSGRMVHESERQLEVAVRMDSLDEGRPLRYEHSVYVYILHAVRIHNTNSTALRCIPTGVFTAQELASGATSNSGGPGQISK